MTDDPLYRCADCDWTGDDYEIVADGSVGGTAVCPDCGGGLRVGAGG